MADISIQFYATEDELTIWLGNWIGTDEITLIAMRFHPFLVLEVSATEIRKYVQGRLINRYCLIASQPNLCVTSKSEFELGNPSALALDIGYLTADGLSESWLACRSSDSTIMAIWRRIERDLRRKTCAGVTAISRQTKKSAFYKSIRYSPGAEVLERAGTQMLPVQGLTGPVIRLGNVTNEVFN